MIKPKVFFAKVKPNAIIPSKRDEDAGLDIYSCFDEDYIVFEPHETKLIPTGLASVFSNDFVFILKERGSTGSKGIGQRCGIIDSGYRNEWFVALTNHNDFSMVISKLSQEETRDEILKTHGVNKIIFYPYLKAICQALLLPVPKSEIVEILYDDLKKIESERGMGMLGDSGK